MGHLTSSWLQSPVSALVTTLLATQPNMTALGELPSKVPELLLIDGSADIVPWKQPLGYVSKPQLGEL